jgi:hypothetical protein
LIGVLAAGHHRADKPALEQKRAAPSAARCLIRVRQLERQFITRVLMRLGTSPTGMTALIFMLAVSMAVTDRSPELEM